MTVNNFGIRVCGLDINDRSEDLMQVVIPSGTPYPTTEEFSVTRYTYADNQASFNLSFIQGESEYADMCTEVYACTIEGIPPAPQGE